MDKPDSGASGNPRLSVIIPALNEEAFIGGILSDLRCQKGLDLEILVSDGGSTDRTEAVASEYGVRFLHGPAGRGVQLNAGGREARGRYLLFLHADSRLADDAILARAVSFLEDRIRAQSRDTIAGHFRLAFTRERSGGDLAWAYVEAKSSLNRENTTNGDQGFLLSASYYGKLGGFEEDLPYFEDQRFAERIRATGQWVTLPGSLTTSARRFEKDGFGKRYLMMAVMMGCYSAGLPGFFHRAERLYAAHHVPGGFNVSPYLDLIRRILSELSHREQCRFWQAAGRYARRNFWQVFFLVDVVAALVFTGYSANLMTRFHDRVLSRLLDFRVVDGFAAVLVLVWFYGGVRPWYRLRERGLKTPSSQTE